jgi:ABC-type lipoprotein release transport system permease subunit
MSFVLIAIFMIGVLVVLLVLVAHYYQGSSAELVDWKPTRSPQVEAENELQDIQQMLDAQNEMRRRRGAPEIDEATLRAEVEAEELERLRWRER